jgi:hypothetical protein
MISNFISIWCNHGMRGNAIYRILSAHPEVYWDKYIHAGSKSQHPLHVASNITSIVGLPDNDIADKIGIWKMGYATYHTASLVGGDQWMNVLHSWISNSTNNKLLLFGIINPYDRKLLKLIGTNKPHIQVYGKLDRLRMKVIEYKPSTNPLAYNLNINNLFSTDYITFETEYFKLIAHFNLTSCLNQVRAFILLVLEREDYISKFY